MSKGLGKYIASFNYFDKSLIVLSATSGAPIGISSAGFSLAFSIATGNVKTCLKQHEIKRKIIMKLLSQL